MSDMTNDIKILIVIGQFNVNCVQQFEYHRNVNHEVNYKRSYKL